MLPKEEIKIFENFFELNKKSFMDGYLANIGNLIWKTEEILLKKIENNAISDRVAKTSKRDINDLKDFEKKWR